MVTNGMGRRGTGIALAFGLVAIIAAQAAIAQPCVVQDNGNGTVNLPPVPPPPGQCPYLSPDDVHEIIAGLPPGTTILLGAAHSRFANVIVIPGGPLGGEREQFNSQVLLELHGTGELNSYVRTVSMNNVQVVTDTAPRGTGTPQDFDTDMAGMQGQLPPGDPDFDLLRITAGTNFGMPSPGHTTLTRLGPPGSNWQVDSFFDVFYRIDFVGAPGGPLGGHSGSTTGTIRMQTGGGGTGGVGCCLPMGLCVITSSVISCLSQGGTVVPGGAGCSGDIDGDGIDEACFAPPCVECGPGPHWIDVPGCPPGGQGQDTLPSGAVLGIDLNFDCIADTNVIAGGPVTIRKRGNFDDSNNFPGLRPIDGHLDVIDTEIIAMSLTGGGVTLKAGTLSGSANPLQASLGAVAEQPGNPNLADSFFDVFFEIEYAPGLYAYNQTAIQVAQTIDCMPPKDNYYHLGGCTPLYNSPFAPAIQVGNLVQANHFTYPSCCSTAFPGGCAANIPVSQCQGTPVPACLGDGNANGIDDACDPQCDRDPASPTGCTNICPPPTTPNEQCLPATAGCNPHQQGSCGVLTCECQDPNFCHLVKDATGYHCEGACPVPPGGVCTLLGTGAFGDPFRCDCIEELECVPNADASDCEPANCPVGPPPSQPEVCRKKCIKIDADGNIQVTDCDCQPDVDCYMELSTAGGRPAPDGADGAVAGGPPGCFEPDAGGTVVLPPAGLDCPYVSPDNFHQIVAGLPAGTTIQVGIEHSRFVNINNQPGGNLGGEKENFNSTVMLNMNGDCSGGGVGPLCSYSRTVQMMNIPVETHVGPRTVGDPVQSFDTDMFMMQGQLPAGDPDFDLLRITAGTGFGMPSPGHTTLTRLPGGASWAVDSFFDVFYRIDYVGAPGGPFGGMSGSTTGTIRMQTTSGFKCRGDCPPGMTCEQTNVPQPDGTNKVCCECVAIPQVCEPNSTGTDCNPVNCPPGPQGTEICLKRCANFNPFTGQVTITECDCRGTSDCHLEYSGGAPARDGGEGIVAGGGNGCVIPDNGGGTVTLPPAGCEYLSPDDVHEIIDGLPVGTTIELGTIHKDFICHGPGSQNPVCTFPTLVDCDEAGGSLGGEKECVESNLELQMTGTGTLAGFNRVITLPIGFETHTAPRIPGNPVQSFDTDMFRLFGQISNPGSGDPDFDLLRIVAGTDFGLPSPGHTTLTQLPGGQWAVDSFFDITYRIDFVGRPGGALSGMSGSTTGTIRMATGDGPKCVGACPQGTVCEETRVVNADGTIDICCDCVIDDPQGACCTTGAAGNNCINTTQSQCQGTFLPGQVCSGIIVACCLPGGVCQDMDEVCCAAASGSSIVGQSCTAPQACCFTSGACQFIDPVCCQAQSGTPAGPGTDCIDADGTGVADDCERCEPTQDGTGCTNSCPPSPIHEDCLRRCATFNPATGQWTTTGCDCRGGGETCNLVYPGGGLGRDDGAEVVAGGPNGCIVPDNGGGTVTLPPPGCDYLSPSEVHMIIDGLPPGTTINLMPIHSQIFCHEQNNVCSFPPGIDCEENGGSLGGQKECNSSTMQFQATCVGDCAGPLAGFNRPITIPNVGFETHLAPRGGGPSQSFDTDMFRLFGQITNPGSGDPDFDLLRIVAGTDFGLPSPGHTTLTRLGPPGSNWAVDSFFDITYRIDFVGRVGGALSGMSGSTTGTIRMGTAAPFKCLGGCPTPRRACTPKVRINPDGTRTVCCDCRPKIATADPTLRSKPRFISMSLAPAAVAGGAEENALRVRLVSLHHVDPPYSGGPSVPFTAFEGQVRYAGPPVVYLESSSNPIRFVASNLQCSPYYRDWTSFNSCSTAAVLCDDNGDCPMGGTCTVPVDPLLHVTGSSITPSSIFEVEVLAESCMGSEDTCEDVSDPLELRSTRWGDVVFQFNPPSTTIQPDITDVSALVDKFRSSPSAPIKAQGMLAGEPGNIFGEISSPVLAVDFGFSHISACVDAFRGTPYPYTISSCP